MNVKDKINLETSKIAWQDLQRFFASGSAICVCNDLDLVEVAHQFTIDNAAKVTNWLESGQIARVSDYQAGDWLARDAQVWAVVVKPWILVQESA